MAQLITPENKVIITPPDAPGIAPHVPPDIRVEMLEEAKKGATLDDFELFRKLSKPTHINDLGGTLDFFGVSEAESKVKYPLKINNVEVRAEDILDWEVDPVTNEVKYSVKNQEIFNEFQQLAAEERARMASIPATDIVLPAVHTATGQITAEKGTPEHAMAVDALGFYGVMKDSGMVDKYVMETIAWNFERGNIFNEIEEVARDFSRLPFNLGQLWGAAKDYTVGYAGVPVEGGFDIVGGRIPFTDIDVFPTFNPGQWLRENLGMVQDPTMYIKERQLQRTIRSNNWKKWVEEDTGFTNYSKQSYLNNKAHEWVKNRIIGEHVQRADTDGDGKVSVEERRVAEELALQEYNRKFVTLVSQPVEAKMVIPDVVEREKMKGVPTRYEDKVIPKMLVNANQAQALLDYSFYQLPLTEKGIKWIAEFLPFMLQPVAAAKSSMTAGGIVKQLKKLAVQGKDGVTYTVGGAKLSLKDIKAITQDGTALTKTIHKNFQLFQTSSTPFLSQLQKTWVRAKFLPGEIFKTGGLADEGINALQSREAFMSLNTRYKKLIMERNSLLKQNKSIVEVQEQIDRVKSRLYNVATLSKKVWMHPSIKGTLHAENAVVAGQMAGYHFFPWMYPDMDNETGALIGALITAFQGHRLLMRIGTGVDNLIGQPFQWAKNDIVYYHIEEMGSLLSKTARGIAEKPIAFAGTHGLGEGVTTTGIYLGDTVEAVIESVTFQPGQLLNRNIDELEEIIVRSGGARALNGKDALTPQQREAFKFLIQMNQGLPADEQQKVWNGILETHKAKENLLKQFQTFKTKKDGFPLEKNEVVQKPFVTDGGTPLRSNEVEQIDGVWYRKGTNDKVTRTDKWYSKTTNEEVIAGDEHLDSELQGMIQQTYADMTSYAPIEGMQSSLSFQLSYGDITRGNLTKILPIIKEEERKRQAVMLGVKMIQSKAKLRGLPEKQINAIEEWGKGITKRFGAMENAIEERNLFYKAALDDYKHKLFSMNGANGATAIEEGVLETIIELDMHFLDFAELPPAKRIVEEKKYFDNLFGDSYRSMGGILEEIKGAKVTDDKVRAALLQAEEMANVTIMAEKKARASSGYRAMDKKTKEVMVDLTSFAEGFFKKLSEASGTDLYLLFSREGRFFTGMNGKKLRSGLVKTINKTFKEAEFDTDVIDEMVSIINAQTGLTDLSTLELFFMIKGNKYPKVKGKIEIPESLKDLPNLKGKETVDSLEELFDGLDSILPFETDFATMEEVYRHFNTVGRATKDETQKGYILQFAKEVDDVLKQKADEYDELKIARETYQKHWFDATRQDSVADVVSKNTDGPRRKMPNQQENPEEGDLIQSVEVKEDKTGRLKFAFSYADDGDPSTWFKGLTKAFRRLIQGDAIREKGTSGEYTNPALVEKFEHEWEKQSIHWMDIITNPDGSEQLGFDLTTDQGKAKFKLFQELVEMNFLDNWGELNEFMLTSARIDMEKVQNIDGIVGYIKPMSRQLDETLTALEDKTQVLVKRGENMSLEKVNAIDFKQIRKSERDIVNLAINNDEIVKAANEVKESTVRKIDSSKAALDVRYNNDLKAIKTLSTVFNINSAEQFVDEMVLNVNGPEKLEELVALLTDPELTKFYIKGNRINIELARGPAKPSLKPDVSIDDPRLDLPETEIEVGGGPPIDRTKGPVQERIEETVDYTAQELDTTNTVFLADKMKHIPKRLLTNRQGPILVEPLDEKTVRRMIAELIVQGVLDKSKYGPLEGKMSSSLFTRIKEKMTQPISGFFTPQGWADGGSLFSTLLSDTMGVGDGVNASNKLNKEALKYGLGEDGYEAMQAFGVWVTANQKTTGSSLVKVQGMLREITPNEALSRGFNLARGMVGPYYVAAEVYLRLMGTHGIDVMRMSLHSPDAGRLMAKLISDPDGFDVRDTRNFLAIMEEFVATELATQGVDLASYEINDELLEDLYYQQRQDPEIYYREMEKLFGQKEEQAGWGAGEARIYDTGTGVFKQ